MMNLIKTALKTTAFVLVTAWFFAQVFPGLFGSVLSGNTPDVTFRNPLKS